MSADKGLMRGFPIQTKLTLVHPGRQVTLAGRMAVELGKAKTTFPEQVGLQPHLQRLGPFAEASCCLHGQHL